MMMYGCSMDQRLMFPRPREDPVVSTRLALKAHPHDGYPTASREIECLTGVPRDGDLSPQIGRPAFGEVHHIGMAAAGVEGGPGLGADLDDVMPPRLAQ